MHSRTSLWIAIIAIPLILLGLFGPWASDSGQPSLEPEVTSSNGANTTPAQAVESEVATPTTVAFGRTRIGPVREDHSVFVVLNPDGEPEVDALLLVCRGETLLLSVMADSNGRVELESDNQEVTLVVKAPGRPLFVHPYQLVPGPIEVRLPRGAMLTGRILDHDGTEPSRLSLWVGSDTRMFDSGSLPEAAREDLADLIRYNTIRAFTSPGGFFQFAGLRESWSGSLQLGSGIVVQSTSGGRLLASGHAIRFDAPQTDLVIQLAKRKVITGRLVESPSNDPLGRIPMTARYQAIHGDAPQITNFVVDKQGYFFLEIDPESLTRFELFLGSHPHDDQLVLELSGPEIPPAGQLGNIAIRSLRTIRFILQDRKAQGIAGGFARAGGARSMVTGPDGEGFLYWLSTTTTRMRFVAKGYVPQDRELNEATPDPLIVTMEPGNRLELKLITPGGVQTSQFRAQLRSNSILIDGPAKDLNELLDYVGEDSRPYYQAQSPPLGTHIAARPDSDGVIVFQSLRSGVELNLEILGTSGDSVFHGETLKPLGRQEVRRHEIDLRQVGSIFRGRITNSDGEPLVRASVQLENQILAWTDGSGDFSCLVNESVAKTLVLGHPSYATLFIKDYLVPTDGAAVEFRLEPTRELIIEVMDESGTAINEAQVFLLREGFISTTHPRGEGRFEAKGSSSDGASVQVMVAGNVYVQKLNPGEAATRVIVPIHGSLVVNFSVPAQQGTGDYSVVLKALAKEQASALTRAVDAAGRWRCKFPLVLPGQYDVSVEYSPSPQEKEEGLSSHTVGNTVTLTINPGQRHALDLK